MTEIVNFHAFLFQNFQYTPSESDFGFSFECRALNPRVGRHSFTLQRAEPPKKIRVSEVKPLTNGAEIIVEPPETGGLPLIEFTIKYDLLDRADSEGQTLTIPGSFESNLIWKFIGNSFVL